MDKFLYHFSTSENFQSQKESLTNDAIAFSKEDGVIRTHGQDYEAINWLELQEGE